MKTREITVTLTAVLMGMSSQAFSQSMFLRSMYELEDPRGYCLDIPGFGAQIRIDAPITTHTCKYSLPGFDVDEIFEHADGKLRLVNYDRCLSSDSMEAGRADVNSIDCGDAHEWQVHADGRVTPTADSGQCLTLAAERVFVNTAIGTVPPYSSRAVSLEPCTSDASYRQRWRWSETNEMPTWNANSLRNGMTRAARAGNREIGPAVNPVATAALYADAPRAFGAADVTVSDEIAYGPEKGHRLRVYKGNNRNSPGMGAPILLLVHGGGFSRGDLSNLAHAATHFASLGFVAVNMTYPLAPEYTWPSGAEAVHAAVEWIHTNIGDYRGNPAQLYVYGHSAGGNHVANYVFRPSLSSTQGDRVAGAILASPALQLPDAPDEVGSDYYDVDGRSLAEMRVLDNIETASIPVLITVAEFDPRGFHRSTAQLLTRLIEDFGAQPRLRQMQGHGHISYVSAIGTSDRLLEEELVDFMLSPR
ncbi:MAG: alpha/beta fold hydrolase [Rhodospirillaceae bacterium]|nr:alpha/beta fold hydrolase [Rhodospirillaceae bacterium]MDD9997706.1 alpha/beta fold hydrolase [Rhodospirillaceae bacterium]MDE0359582.1 alpha/beta fold hydrolase [Rhodospirillaceae bacterium]